MSLDARYVLGAAAIAALLASAAYLWRLLRDFPISRRLVNLLMPASQIGLVVCAFALRPFFAQWDTVAAVVVPVGIAGAALNPFFFKGLLEAENAEIEADRVAFLEDQVATQEQYAALQPAGDSEDGGMNDSVPAFPAFTGKDLDGNDVDNSIFSQNAVTVVNFWFSGCKPCVAELGELNALNETLKKQGGAVVGINVDTLDGNADAISTAKNLLESKGASYQNIYFPSDSAAGDFAGDIMAFPTTYVIDRSGAIVGEAMLGGIDNEDNMAALQKLIDQALANDSAK